MAHSSRSWRGARTPQGKKRVRQSQARHAILQPRRTAAKTEVKDALQAAAGGDAEATAIAVAMAASALDRAAKVGAIHPNAAARRKSRLMRKVGLRARRPGPHHDRQGPAPGLQGGRRQGREGPHRRQQGLEGEGRADRRGQGARRALPLGASGQGGAGRPGDREPRSTRRQRRRRGRRGTKATATRSRRPHEGDRHAHAIEDEGDEQGQVEDLDDAAASKAGDLTPAAVGPDPVVRSGRSVGRHAPSGRSIPASRADSLGGRRSARTAPAPSAPASVSPVSRNAPSSCSPSIARSKPAASVTPAAASSSPRPSST